MASTRYFVSRTIQAVFTLFVVMSASFFMIRWLPGGPQDYLLSQLVGQPGMTQERINRLMQQYMNVAPNKPMYLQYVDYMSSLLHGHLGISIWYHKPVIDIVASGMPWTIYLSAVSLLFTFTTGVGLGAIMAYREKSNFDAGMTIYTTVVHSFPYYLFALLILWIFAFTTHWFPIGGRMGENVTPGLNPGFVISVLYHSFLPILSLMIIGFGGTALGMRANSIRVLGEDYLRVARLRGLSDRRIALRYVARNAILPLYTGLMISIGSLFGGSVILEEIFNYQGMGYYMFKSVSSRDYPLMMGCFLFITAGVILGIYIADLTYGWIDPRAGSGGSRESFAGGVASSPLRTARIWIRGLVNRSGSERDEFSSPERPMSDGSGTVDANSPFLTVSDVTLSRSDRTKQVFDEAVLAPFRIIWSDWRARFGFLVILLFVLAGTIGVILIPSPRALRYPQLAPPFQSLAYPLGTDNMGKSILAELVHSTPAMFKMMIGGAVYATIVAALWGVFSGYVGGKVDRVMMGISDVLMTIPGLPLIIVVATLIEPKDPFLVGIVISINGWAGGSRVFRSQVLTLRSSAYVEASRTMGISTWEIMLKDIIPDLMPLIFLRFVGLAKSVISASVGLYFLGILPYTTLNWGVMLNRAYSSGTWYSLRTIHWILAPIMTILLLSVGLILFGQSLDHIFNPRIRTRHMKSSPDEIEDVDADSSSTTTTLTQ